MGEPNSLSSRLRIAVARLARRLRQEGMHEDATPSQLTALATLYHSGPMTIGDLAGAERVKPPTMTRIVAALEERRLVRRVASDDDGRVFHVNTTAAGRRAHEEYQKRRDEWLRGRLAGLTQKDREILDRASDILDRLVES